MSIINTLKGFIYGLVFGFGSPVPGVSAGSLAVILNVYERFFNSISVKYVRQNWLVTLFFLVGWALGLYGVSSVFVFLFENHSVIISFCFIGLIMGSLPIIYKKATASTVEYKNIGMFVLSFAFMLYLSFLDGSTPTYNDNPIGDITLAYLAWIFFASFVSSMAMLIPGVGGSLIMIVFGIYAVYIESVSTVNAMMLAVFLVSMVLGVLAGIVITKKILARFAQALYFAILGFIIGSLFIIFPGFSFDAEGLVAVVLMICCVGLAYWLSKKG